MSATLRASWLAADSESAVSVASDIATEAQGLKGSVDARLYELTGGGEHMSNLGRRLGRLPDFAVEKPPTHLMLTRTASLAEMMMAEDYLRGAEASVETGELSVVAKAVYAPASQALGQAETDGESFGQAIQFGTFSMRSIESEWELAQWYEDMRLPSILQMPSAIRATRYVSVCGPAKFGILYEFTSLEARMNEFENIVEVQALDTGHPTGQVVKSTVHAPMSPSIGSALA